MPRAPGWPATPATASPTSSAWNANWPRCAHGLARDDEELELGVRCMAAGIYDDQGQLVAGLSMSAPADRLEEILGRPGARHRRADLESLGHHAA
jgi:DNA-binding IclR family transcriptional regulator